jgi:hypothetical protein
VAVGFVDALDSGDVKDYKMEVKMMMLKNLLKRFVKAALRMGLDFVKGHPKLRSYVTAVVRKLGLNGVARSVYTRLKMGAYSQVMDFNYFIPKDVSHLPPHARQIYLDLKKVIEHLQQENR